MNNNKTYRVNEVFYSLQGEGVRAGTPNVFVRFSGCNMECDLAPGPKSPGGFVCDTEFVSGRPVSLEELAEWCSAMVDMVLQGFQTTVGPLRANKLWPEPWLVLTGGEPGLQVDEEFCGFWHDRGVKLAIETNGSIDLCSNVLGIDWITVSPKVAEHGIKCLSANEVKYVRGYGQAIPKTKVTAIHYLISPAFDGMNVSPKTLSWCNELCLNNPPWRLSLQLHKFLKVR